MLQAVGAMSGGFDSVAMPTLARDPWSTSPPASAGSSRLSTWGISGGLGQLGSARHGAPDHPALDHSVELHIPTPFANAVQGVGAWKAHTHTHTHAQVSWDVCAPVYYSCTCYIYIVGTRTSGPRRLGGVMLSGALHLPNLLVAYGLIH